MRILSITAQKPDSTGSGVYLSELVRAFDRMGHEQAVIAGIYREDHPCFPAGTAFFPVYFETEALPFPIAGMSDEMPYRSTRYSDMTPEMEERFCRAFVEAAREAVEAFRPDLILCHHLYLMTAAIREAFPGLPVYGFCHNTDLRQMRKTDLKRQYIREQIRRLDRIFVPQEEQQKGVLEVYGPDPGKLRQVGIGYNPEIFHKRNKLVFAGKISEKKGVKSLLRSMELLAESGRIDCGRTELYLAGGAGDEREYQEILDLAERCPVKVHLPGRLSQERLAALYNECGLFVLPSYYDAIPLVAVEALACGCKVVISDLPGVREWIGGAIEHAGIRYVPLPPMKNTDEPVAEALPAFEERLAAAIEEALLEQNAGLPKLDRLSWESVARRVLEP